MQALRAADHSAVIERYELKYVVPVTSIRPITDFVSAYCRLDEHSLDHAGHFYPVNSLYFDTLNYRFLKQRLWGVDRRFNMRVRAYGDGSRPPFFGEVKFKAPTFVKKFRATLDARYWSRDLAEHCGHSSKDGDTAPAQLFTRLAQAYAIEPKIFTCYQRRAFISEVDDYARVTMDINLRYRPQTPLVTDDPYNLCPDERCINYDIESTFGEEMHLQNCVVLELKATSGHVPVWMLELIRRFELKQVSFSKYANSSLVENLDNGWRYMDAARLASVST